MKIAEIYVAPAPWLDGKTLLGIVAQIPGTGKLQIALEHDWQYRLIDTFEVLEPSSNAVDANGDDPFGPFGGIATAFSGYQFLDSLDDIISRLNASVGAPDFADVFRALPDRGTPFKLAQPRSVDASEVEAALEVVRQNYGSHAWSEVASIESIAYGSSLNTGS